MTKQNLRNLCWAYLAAHNVTNAELFMDKKEKGSYAAWFHCAEPQSCFHLVLAEMANTRHPHFILETYCQKMRN